MGGSGRNIENSPIDNLKDFILSTELFSFAAGHSSSFGCEIKKENIKSAIAKTNELLKNVSFDKLHLIDFIFNSDDITIEIVKEFDELKNYWGTNIREPLILINNIKLNTKNLQIMGKESDTWKFIMNKNEIVAIKFKCSPDDEINQLNNSDWGGIELTISAIGKLNISNFNNVSVPQFTIMEYDIINKD